MANPAIVAFYKTKLHRVLEDLGVTMFDFTDIAGLQEDILAISASLKNPEHIVWNEASRSIEAKWSLKDLTGVTAGLDFSVRPAGNLFQISHHAEQHTLLWITVVVQTANQYKRRHYIRWAKKGRDATVWAPWIDKYRNPGEDGCVGVLAKTVPLQLVQLKRKVEYITELVLKMESANMDARVNTAQAEPGVLEQIANALKVLTEDVNGMKQLLGAASVGASLSSAALLERLRKWEPHAGQTSEQQSLSESMDKHSQQTVNQENYAGRQ
ncbi:hypothetical protein AAVH_03319 [Aphelenchoides avenae]|nr:hypothetical protein AAVH_03319 [Aphelenchus avenae]